MELIYKNEYGACYSIYNAPNSNFKFQMIVDTIGVFMSERDMSHLLDVIRGSFKSCNCEECGGKRYNKIWMTNPLIDACLKVDDDTLELMEDLILGTRFILNMDATLEKNRIK